MIKTETYRYAPDYAVSPGEILDETLSARGIKKSDLAARCNLSAKTISHILSAKAPITPPTALCLENVTGIPAATWANLEANYRLHQARVEKRKELGKHLDWTRSFPLKELIIEGFIQKTDNPGELVEQLLNFFGAGSIDAINTKTAEHVRYRRSTVFEASKESIATWLRIGELRGEEIQCEPYEKTKFEKVLSDIRELTCKDPMVFQKKMVALCASAGVALVFFPELPKTHICGATKWLNKDKALIMLSLRFKSDDHLWFSFFHEAGHLLLHGKKAVFVEVDDGEEDNQEEQANRFAADYLIPPSRYQELLKLSPKSDREIKKFAKEEGIAPGIVVGRLQHDRIISFRSTLNSLKCKFEFGK